MSKLADCAADGVRTGRPPTVSDQQIRAEIARRLSGAPEELTPFRIQRALEHVHNSIPRLDRIQRWLREMHVPRQAPPDPPRQPNADLNAHNDLVRTALEAAYSQIVHLTSQAVLATEDGLQAQFARALAALDADAASLAARHAAEIEAKDREIADLMRLSDDRLDQVDAMREEMDAERVGAQQLVDESARRRLVGGRKLVRLGGNDGPGDPQHRVERGVSDDEREDERPRDRSGVAVEPLHQQPEHPAEPSDQEQLRDVQAEEQSRLVADLGVSRRVQQAEAQAVALQTAAKQAYDDATRLNVSLGEAVARRTVAEAECYEARDALAAERDRRVVSDAALATAQARLDDTRGALSKLEEVADRDRQGAAEIARRLSLAEATLMAERRLVQGARGAGHAQQKRPANNRTPGEPAAARVPQRS